MNSLQAKIDRIRELNEKVRKTALAELPEGNAILAQVLYVCDQTNSIIERDDFTDEYADRYLNFYLSHVKKTDRIMSLSEKLKN